MLKPTIASGIALGLEVMMLAINFHAQLCAIAIEVEDIGSSRMLAPESKPGLLLSKDVPKEIFG